MLLLAEALSPRLGDNVADAQSRGRIAGVLRMNRGRAYHDRIKSPTTTPR
jgi:hypothetical protein